MPWHFYGTARLDPESRYGVAESWVDAQGQLISRMKEPPRQYDRRGGFVMNVGEEKGIKLGAPDTVSFATIMTLVVAPLRNTLPARSCCPSNEDRYRLF